MCVRAMMMMCGGPAAAVCERGRRVPGCNPNEMNNNNNNNKIRTRCVRYINGEKKGRKKWKKNYRTKCFEI